MIENDPSETFPWDEPEDSWVSPAPAPPTEPAAFNPVAFQDWLRVGLEGHFRDGFPLKKVFPELAGILPQHVGLAPAMKELYDRQDSVRRSAFRHAIAGVMVALDNLPENIPIFIELLHIAQMVNAQEIFPALIYCVSDRGWQYDTDPEDIDDSLYTKVLLTVSGLATPADKARKCLKMVLDSPAFHREKSPYAMTALVALTRVEPRNFRHHLDKLRIKLNEQIETYSPPAENLRRIAATLLNSVGAERFLAELVALNDCELEDYDNLEESYIWLYRAVFKQAESTPPLLKCQQREVSILDPIVLDTNPRGVEHYFIWSQTGAEIPLPEYNPVIRERLFNLIERNGWLPRTRNVRFKADWPGSDEAKELLFDDRLLAAA